MNTLDDSLSTVRTYSIRGTEEDSGVSWSGICIGTTRLHYVSTPQNCQFRPPPPGKPRTGLLGALR